MLPIPKFRGGTEPTEETLEEKALVTCQEAERRLEQYNAELKKDAEEVLALAEEQGKKAQETAKAKTKGKKGKTEILKRRQGPTVRNFLKDPRLPGVSKLIDLIEEMPDDALAALYDLMLDSPTGTGKVPKRVHGRAFLGSYIRDLRSVRRREEK